ncbi:MAG: tRNA 2-selenouridine(34) synthase MnmH [Bacteroidetes bacterium]|nr:tRNA 2-selenouridine(34) synthase MnmH [Bacteroidota bacterium]
MPSSVPIGDFLNLANELPIIDVRSPKEFAKGHIPGASNIELFSDEERAMVGTIYKQVGKKEALDKAVELIDPKKNQLVLKAEELAPDKKALVHCWRGGMRSERLATFLEMHGFESFVLEKGYKAYRQYIHAAFEKPVKLLVLGGMTGSGKTDVLQALGELGEQILDLEHHARHKGSSFGHIGQEEQPTTEQFENELGRLWIDMDMSKPIWVEDESKTIGTVHLPEALYKWIRSSPVIKLELKFADRIKRLVRDYSVYDNELLKQSILRISKRLGDQNAVMALEALEADEHETVAEITLKYYDKAYSHGLSKRDHDTIFDVQLEADDPAKNAAVVKDFVYQNLDRLWKK